MSQELLEAREGVSSGLHNKQLLSWGPGRGRTSRPLESTPALSTLRPPDSPPDASCSLFHPTGKHSESDQVRAHK